jgi:cyclophilin family peptidyl-prolyl cis-trans isomerase
MAKTGAEAPGTSGSQFYVVTGSDAAQLPPEYALLGKVTRGMDVVDRIGAVPVEGEGAPVDPVVIRSIRVQES